jgi:hypothetical protein
VDGHSLYVTAVNTTTELLVSNTGVAAAAGSEYELYRWRYNLPDDFSEFVGGVVYTEGDSRTTYLRNVVDSEIRLRHAANFRTDDPTMYAIIPGTLATELLGETGWTSTDWVGSWGAGWTHATGNTTALTNTLAAVIGDYYRIAFTVAGRSAGSFTVTFGGQTTSAYTATNETRIRATTTGTLSITPTSDFDGKITISIVSGVADDDRWYFALWPLGTAVRTA